MKTPAFRNKPVIKFALHDNQQDAFVPSYTTLDKIQGDVVITAPNDTSFDEIYVTLEGTTKTFVEKIATASPTNGRTEAVQVFLRLIQPMNSNAFPESRTLKGGLAYRLPFTFVVPEKLLPQSCGHVHVQDSVQDAHLSLPPSFGDPMTTTLGKTLLDDMAPEMSVISYAIKVRIIHGRGSTGKQIIAAENSKKIRIIPALKEDPPVVVLGGLKDDYRLRKEKEVKKGLFKGKLGCITVESAQPKSLQLPPLNSTNTCPVTTMATVRVRFDPAEDGSKPPRLSTLSTKIKAATYFASVPMIDIPAKATEFYYNSTRGIYVETVPLSSRCVAAAQWECHSSDTPIRRDSGFSTLSNPIIPMPSSSYAGNVFYTTQLLVPVTLPQSKKTFVPTFHSCLISRVYYLDLCLGINSPSPTVTAPNLHLKLPIQISSEANPDARPSISAQEAEAIAAREAYELLSPRSLVSPHAGYNEGSRFSGFEFPSPEYSESRDQDTRHLPSPDYVEHAQSTVCSEIQTASPPEYSNFSQRSSDRARAER